VFSDFSRSRINHKVTSNNDKELSRHSRVLSNNITYGGDNENGNDNSQSNRKAISITDTSIDLFEALYLFLSPQGSGKRLYMRSLGDKYFHYSEFGNVERIEVA
jgi:hypothetical protein